MLDELIENSEELNEEINENSEELNEEINENSEELNENYYDLTPEQLEYLLTIENYNRSMASYNEATEQYNTEILENIENMLVALNNTAYVGVGAIVSLFVFVLLALVVKFFKNLFDF